MARQLAENPDTIRRFYAEGCACGAVLNAAGQDLAKAYDHIDIPPIRPVTTRIELFRATCPCCKARVTAGAPADMPEGTPFGPGITSIVTYLHGCQMVGYKRLTEVCQGLFGLTISQGAIANMLARVGKTIAEPAERIAEKVRLSEVIASDETSARVKGKTWWQWTFGCATAVYFVMAETRGKCVPMAFLAGAKPKMWLSDRLPAQCRHAEEHQFCLAHLSAMRSLPSTTATPSSPRASRRCSRMPVPSAAAGPVSPTPPLPPTAAVSRRSWSGCSR